MAPVLNQNRVNQYCLSPSTCPTPTHQDPALLSHPAPMGVLGSAGAGTPHMPPQTAELEDQGAIVRQQSCTV